MSETNKARERLRACLKYEENRFSRIGTHGVGCWQWGPSHYECALRESERKDAALREAREVILHFANARGSQFEGSEAEAVGFIDAALSASPTPAKSGERRSDGWGTLPFPADTKALQSQCNCRRCIDERGERPTWFIVCPKCGNKRCPKASDHRFRCTGSNALGQTGETEEPRNG